MKLNTKVQSGASIFVLVSTHTAGHLSPTYGRFQGRPILKGNVTLVPTQITLNY
jgi:hypothetical protein